ncbi:Equilibrative nucleoside transporter 1 [Carabus blaptoides fortunei]
MDYSVNTRPLLQETDSETDNQNDITDTNQSKNEEPSTCVSDTRPLFRPHGPIDKYYTCYLIFYLLGIATLLPWNFFITADDYWMYKFRNIHDNSTHLMVTPGNRTPLQKEFTSYLSIASAVPNTIFLILSTFINRKISLSIRMIGSLIVLIVFFIVTTVFVNINTDKWQHEFFLITMGSVIVLNIACAILAGSIFGIVGKFSPAYITAVISGQALGGIFTALVEILSLATGESSVHSAFLYFMVGNFLLILTLVLYIVLSKTVFFQYHLDEKQDGVSTSIQADPVRPPEISYMAIFDKIWLYGVSEWLVFVITLSIYPGVTVLIESQNKGTGDKWSGRILAGYFQWPHQKGRLLLALNFIRLAFIPLLLLCNAQPRHHLPVLIRNDIYYVLLMCLFSLSNGYLANIAVICAPRAVEHHEKETASSMMAAFLGVGLSMGSVISLLMVKLL